MKILPDRTNGEESLTAGISPTTEGFPNSDSTTNAYFMSQLIIFTHVVKTISLVCREFKMRRSGEISKNRSHTNFFLHAVSVKCVLINSGTKLGSSGGNSDFEKKRIIFVTAR